jgi:hypothetical protein
VRLTEQAKSLASNRQRFLKTTRLPQFFGATNPTTGFQGLAVAPKYLPNLA